MRRRIYVDPEGDLLDETERAYLFRDDDQPEPGQRFSICDRGALYNESLWARYVAACEVANDLRNKVCEALVREPYDEVERAVRTEWNAADEYDAEQSHTWEAQLRENARRRRQS